MFLEIFVLPLCDDDCCDCNPKEKFEEEAKVDLDPCSAGTCDCVPESKVSPFTETTPVDEKAFNELFNKYTEANKLVLSLQRDNEHLKQINKNLAAFNEEIIEKSVSLTKQRDEVYNALKAFEKRIAALPA